ncbi:MAG TPA: SulP family inorganic anion transporter [Rhizobiales bacterium]|nr:SulP family inorganic anion transporter [Hyphomicrobiales bacterium]
MTIIHGFHLKNLRGDIYGGLTAAVVALPLALAMGVSSGAGPVAGLYGAIFVGLFAALFGGTPAQVSGPTGPMTVVMAAIFTQYTAMYPQNPGYGAALAFTVVIMGGGFQILMGVFKLGKYINLIPNPVVSGFMTGIGVIIILLQLGPLFGHDAKPGPMASLLALPSLLDAPVWTALALGGFALVIVYLLPTRLNRILPAPLLALFTGTLALYLWTGGEITSVVENGKTVYHMGAATVLGNIPSGLPSPIHPVFEMSLLPGMIKSALTLAALGAIDSLLTSLVADNITRTYHRSDRELIGQGIGNMFAGLFGGLPGAGATMRTVVNVRAGGLTPVSGALHAVVLLAVVLGAGSIARYIPHALLAGILVKVGTDIIDWDYLRHLPKAPRAGIAIMITVFVCTVFVDLITAVAIGMIMAAFIFMQRMVDYQLASTTLARSNEKALNLSPEESELLEQAEGRILIYHLRGALSFGAAKAMARRLAMFDQYDVLVLDMRDVSQVDSTTTKTMQEMIEAAWACGREVILVGCRPRVSEMLNRKRIIDNFNGRRLKHDRLAALRDALKIVQDRQL